MSPQLITADQITQPYDAVLLAVKGFQLEAALADLAKAIGPETMMLPVLNGMRHMDILAERPSALSTERPAYFLKPKKRGPDQWAPVISRATSVRDR